MSHSPGIRYLSLPSTTLAVFGMGVAPLLPTCEICLPSTITVISACTGVPVASIKLTWVIARAGSCAGATGTPGTRRIRNNEMPPNCLSMSPLARGQILTAEEQKHKSHSHPSPRSAVHRMEVNPRSFDPINELQVGRKVSSVECL